MKTLIFALALVLTTFSYAQNPDVVFCHKNAANELQGYYSPDYLLSKTGHADSQFIADRNFRNYKWFSYFYDLKYLGLAQRIEYFRTDLLKPYSVGQSYIWEKGEQGFPSLPSYPAQAKLPANCQGPGYRAVVASLSPLATLFEYDVKILDELRRTNELQYSFVLLRVFLSQFTDDSELIREINFKLHLNETFTNSALASRLKLLLLSPKSERSICERSLSLVEAFEKELRLSCQTMTYADLRRLTKLKIQDINREDISFKNFSFRKNDFKELTSLKELDLSGIQWLGTSFFSFQFSDLKNLLSLNLSRSYLNDIWAGMFAGIKNLKLLDLTHSRINTIQDGAFAGIMGPGSTLVLTGYSSQALRPGIFSGMENLETLILQQAYVNKFENNALSPLRNLKHLDLSRPRGGAEAHYGNNLQASVLPKLISLNASYAGGVLKQLGQLPTLLQLDVSYTYVMNNELALLKKTPNLRYLNLSKTNFSLPYEGDAFQSLIHLEYLVVMGFHSLSGSTNDSFFYSLPQSLKLLDICYEDNLDINFWKSNLKKFLNSRPNLKIRTKYNCQGDWIEIPR